MVRAWLAHPLIRFAPAVRRTGAAARWQWLDAAQCPRAVAGARRLGGAGQRPRLPGGAAIQRTRLKRPCRRAACAYARAATAAAWQHEHPDRRNPPATWDGAGTGLPRVPVNGRGSYIAIGGWPRWVPVDRRGHLRKRPCTRRRRGTAAPSELRQGGPAAAPMQGRAGAGVCTAAAGPLAQHPLRDLDRLPLVGPVEAGDTPTVSMRRHGFAGFGPGCAVRRAAGSPSRCRAVATGGFAGAPTAQPAAAKLRAWAARSTQSTAPRCPAAAAQKALTP